MLSLRKKYLLLNSCCAILSIGAIGWFFYICNDGFMDLVSISAKNLNSLYTTGELKSLLWKEMSLSNNKESRQAFEKSSARAALLAKNLHSTLEGDNKKRIEEFIQIHKQLHLQIQERGGGDVRELYDEAFRKLSDFGETVLLGSQEQQGARIRGTNLTMKIALVGTALFTFVILLLSYLYFQKRVIRPLITISTASLKVAQGSYQKIEGVSLNDEIGVLAVNFNEMVRGIQESADAIRAERDNAERANQAKSAFLANMSHELRTPMHGILSYARFGQQKIDNVPKERLKSYFDEIHESGTRLMTVLNDILDLSKLEAGKIVYSIEQGNFTETVCRVVEELKAFAEERKLRFEVNRTDALIANYDNMRMMQVVRNILSNAVKFSSPGVVIRIELESGPDGLRCQIVNQGIGIPSDELESVFDKFVQSSKTRTGAGGTGLGLAICKEIIEQHGGKIWAESEQNAETRFTFTLPNNTENRRAS